MRANQCSQIWLEPSLYRERALLFSTALYLGSGDWIRTSDLVVTPSHYFNNGVDYLIILKIGCRALLKDYC
jgi:hypothetical protein